MASSVAAAAAEPGPALAPPPASSGSTASSISPAQSRAEKAAALRAKILAKQGQRMAIVTGHADTASAVKHTTSTGADAALPSSSSAAAVAAPAAATDISPSPSASASASQSADSFPAQPLAAALRSTAWSPSPSAPSLRPSDGAVSSAASAASAVSAVVLMRSLSVTLGLVAAVFPSVLSFSSSLCLLFLMQASLYCLRLSSSPGSSVPASLLTQAADDSGVEAAVSRVLPASLSSAVAVASGVASLLLSCTQLVDACCLFVAVQVAVQAGASLSSVSL